MTISIITCTYNSEKHLAQCIESVQAQDYKDVRHIFIDGMSTDATIDIIHKYYSNPIIFQNKDSGVYDAFNRALSHITTDIFTFLHSDDFYIDKNCLSRVSDIFSKSNIDYYSAQIIVWDAEKNVEIAKLGAPMHTPTFTERLKVSNYFAHPTNFWKKSVIEKVGFFDLRYKIAADVDWMYRLQKANLKQYFEEVPIAYLRNSGTSGSRIFKALWEEYLVALKHEENKIVLTLIYIWHFVRRGVRRLLEMLSMYKVIEICRKLLAK